jgi:DNA-binding NarL/FixJ family response regulator
MIRVLIKASSPVVRSGLTSMLRSFPHIQIVEGTSGDFDFAEDASTGLQADVVLAATEGDEISLTEIERTAGEAPLILLASDRAERADAFRHGVRAVLPGHVTGPQIVAAIEAVAVGLGVFDPEEIDQLVTLRGANETPAKLLEALTPREIQVLRAMAEGLGNKEIAAQFGISENTVKFHVGSVMGKLGAASRTEAVMLGIRHGLVLI